MALKITTQISTDRGVTSEAYVRITNYSVSKIGFANFTMQTFLSQETAVPSNVMIMETARNYEIGDTLSISLIDPSTMLPNFSELDNQDIFAYGYAKLKEKLIGLYGAENVIDC